MSGGGPAQLVTNPKAKNEGTRSISKRMQSRLNPLHFGFMDLAKLEDIIGNGKSGTKARCLKSAVSALDGGISIFIDRCNLDKEQRTEFVKLWSLQID
ncbi:hypothetical protein SAY87_006769 [Trapa incisa]|uniref:Uncharacterized protein n=1 Tax=Trapa incisa TaxID=236973 RepID=A0AAN7K069_9MYRT|nr:hypothetical protein SAY87_006769 [Trapa incisa]